MPLCSVMGDADAQRRTLCSAVIRRTREMGSAKVDPWQAAQNLVLKCVLPGWKPGVHDALP